MLVECIFTGSSRICCRDLFYGQLLEVEGYLVF